VSTTFAPPEPGRHGWAELLRLLDAMRRLVELTEKCMAAAGASLTMIAVAGGLQA
jgi:hypothetical protein